MARIGHARISSVGQSLSTSSSRRKPRVPATWASRDGPWVREPWPPRSSRSSSRPWRARGREAMLVSEVILPQLRASTDRRDRPGS